MDQLQFYPTPPALAERMWHKFQDQRFYCRDAEILEPSAGCGDLLKAMPADYHRDPPTVDVCEIDPARVQQLDATENVVIVGHDFLDFHPGKQYSHIIMNPPFHNGTRHLLHAWEIASHAEIVCLLNAETLRNPCNKERETLLALIEQFGDYEYLDEAFLDPDSQRKTPVSCALVYLQKTTALSHDYLAGLALDQEAVDFDPGTKGGSDLALPENVIQNAVRVYNAAKTILHRKIESEAVLNTEYARWSGILGGSILESNVERSRREAENSHWRTLKSDTMASAYNEKHGKLKEQAWSYVLTGLRVVEQLSTKARKSFYTEFSKVQQLEFTEANIHGFLAGVASQRSAMSDEMMLDIFDRITERHTDNRAYYRSWQSNAKHRGLGWRIKYSRIVLPIRVTSDWNESISNWEGIRELDDFDKSFANLDSKRRETITGITDVILGGQRDNGIKTRSSERYQSDYFDFRYYFKAGTIHLYPRNKTLIDRLNRTVGRLRQWLPEEDHQASAHFWEQYQQAEKTTPLMDVKKHCQGISYWRRREDNAEYRAAMELAHGEACEGLGIPLDRLEAAPDDKQLAIAFTNDKPLALIHSQ